MIFADSTAMEEKKNITMERCNSEDVVCEQNVGNSKLIYRLIRTVSTIEGKEYQVYGVKVICNLFGRQETEFIADVTTEYKFALELFNVIVDNAVLPSTLRDIVEDLIVKKYTF